MGGITQPIGKLISHISATYQVHIRHPLLYRAAVGTGSTGAATKMPNNDFGRQAWQQCRVQTVLWMSF